MLHYTLCVVVYAVCPVSQQNMEKEHSLSIALQLIFGLKLTTWSDYTFKLIIPEEQHSSSTYYYYYHYYPVQNYKLN